MVFCGLYPIDGDDFEMRESLEKLKLNDASDHLRARVVRCARVRVPLRLPRPAAHGDRQGAPRARVRPQLIATAPSVEYRVHKTNGEVELVDNPADLPPMPQSIDSIEEPYFRVASSRPRSTPARSWTSARPGAAT
jgi:GTP-binding protein LepA